MTRELKEADVVYSAGDFSNMQNAWTEALERELALRAENERLRGELSAMVRTTIRGEAHDDGDYTATFTLHELDRARRALERKPE